MLTFIVFILVLSFLIFIHELGHFLAARKVGVKVHEFSIGFPPKIVSKTINGTKYMISWIPLGGYVRLHGQDPESENPDEPDNYAAKSVTQRFFILVAGSFMNFLVALVFMPIVFYMGYNRPAFLEQIPQIGSVTSGSVAEKVGIQKGDQILQINGEIVKTWLELQQGLEKVETPTLSIKIQRGEQRTTLSISSEEFANPTAFGWNPYVEPTIGEVTVGSPAGLAALQQGDRILSVGGEPLEQWSEITPLIQKSKGKAIEFVISRKGENLNKLITPQWNDNGKYWLVGINTAKVKFSENFTDSVKLGVLRIYHLTKATFNFIGDLLTGQAGGNTVGGPIMIAQMVGQAAQTGLSELFSLIAFISLQLAIFNMLPIPALDGGHILFLVFEKIKGSALSKNFRFNMQKAGFSLLLLLIIYISVQDGLRLFQ